MKKKIFLQFALVVLLFFVSNSLSAKKSDETVKSEITKTLEIWNSAGKSANLDLAMSLFDNSANIMLVGSSNGEVFKGKDQAKEWLTQLFGFGSFSWEMSRIDIDSNGKTAWVFVEGKMIVKFHQGGTKITPYRFTGIMVKKKGVWKWRLFDGSVPEKG